MELVPKEKTIEVTEVFDLPKENLELFKGVREYVSVTYRKTEGFRKDAHKLEEQVFVRYLFGEDPSRGYAESKFGFYAIDGNYADIEETRAFGLGRLSLEQEIIALLKITLPSYVSRILPKPLQSLSPKSLSPKQQ